MKATNGNLRLSASDLSNSLACGHLTTLDLSVASGARPVPKWNSPDAWVLQQRGLAHENAYTRHLQSQGLSAISLQALGNETTASEETRSAMQAGIDVITQAVLAEGNWFGRADVLRKTALPSKFGNWSYESLRLQARTRNESGNYPSTVALLRSPRGSSRDAAEFDVRGPANG